MDRESSTKQPTVDMELRPYEVFMLFLCSYSILSLAAESFMPLAPGTIVIMDSIDNVICGIFLLDFLIGFGQARNKLQFLSWGWIDLVSSIPAIDFVQAGRIVRVIRILRVLRGVRLARILAKYLQHNRADGTILAVIFVAILLLLLSSVAILQVEDVEGGNIKSPSDALWWAISTMTTVGYGDKYPTTTIGRIIASVLMIGGVGVFGTLSGSVASWILNPVEQRQEIDLDAIQRELVAIHARLDEVSSLHASSSDPELLKLNATWLDLPEATRIEVLRLTNISPN